MVTVTIKLDLEQNEQNKKLIFNLLEKVATDVISLSWDEPVKQPTMKRPGDDLASSLSQAIDQVGG